MTIREYISELNRDIARGSLDGHTAAELLNKAVALFGTVNDKLVQRQMDYNNKLSEMLDAEKSAKKGEVKAQTTEEYQSLLEVKMARETLVEMIRGLKYTLRALEDEYESNNSKYTR